MRQQRNLRTLEGMGAFTNQRATAAKRRKRRRTLVSLVVATLMILPGSLLVASAAAPATLTATLHGSVVRLDGQGFPSLSSVTITSEFGDSSSNSTTQASTLGAFTSDIPIPEGFSGYAFFTARAKVLVMDKSATATPSQQTPDGSTPSASNAGTSASSALADPDSPAPNEPLAEGPTVFVATDGNDVNPGTQELPVQTLTKARDLARTQREIVPAETEITVYLRKGTYPAIEPLQLNKDDSFTSFRSFPGERATLSGGVTLPASGFAPVGADLAGRLPAEVRSSVLEFDLTTVGVGELPAPPRVGQGMPGATAQPELFAGNSALTLAQWPNDDYLNTTRASGGEGQPITFTLTEAQGKTWTSTSDLMVTGYPRYEWADVNLHVTQFDAATGQVVTADASAYGVADGKPMRFFNVLEEIDQLGEYFIDRTSKKLYVLPPANFATSPITLSTTERPLVEISEASGIRLSDLTISAGRGDGVVTKNSKDITLNRLVVQNIGQVGISATGGQSVLVKSSLLQHTGQGGASLSGGDRTTLAPGNHAVEDTLIRNYARVRNTYSPAVTLWGVGNRASHNEITDSQHVGIILHGNDHVIEYNEIHRIQTQSGDVGAVYLGRDWSEAGNIIRYNYIHDIGSPRYDNNIGIYLDDLASGTLVQGNIVARADVGMLVGGGRNNTLTDNVMVETTAPLTLDARGLGWASASCTPPSGVMFVNLNASAHTSPIWTERYPWLSGIPSSQPCAPRDNILQRNLYVGGTERIDEPARTGNIFTGNWNTISDPGFTDAASSHYTFRADAPVHRQIPGFVAPPFEQMGIRR